MQFHL